MVTVIAILVFTIIVSLLAKKQKDLFVVGYIVAIVTVTSGPRRITDVVRDRNEARPFTDLKKVWYLAAIVVLLFQLLPPEFGVAHLFGFYHQLLHDITQRTSQIPGLVGAAVILTLVETIVYQVCIQERLSWFIGTPAAILVAMVLVAGLAHAPGTSGELPRRSHRLRGSRARLRGPRDHLGQNPQSRIDLGDPLRRGRRRNHRAHGDLLTSIPGGSVC